MTTTTERLEYPLSPRYIPSWSTPEALRELIANALDADKRPRVVYTGTHAKIEDSASGIPRSFWVLGEGLHGDIGQFGEGLKMAMLVLARQGKDVVLSTVGYDVRPSLGYSASYETNVLVLEFTPNSRSQGTEVLVECSSYDYQDARSRFLHLNKVRTLNARHRLLDASGSVYINGVYAQSINSLWGYNMVDKRLTNRDRSVLDMMGVRRHVTEVLEGLGHVGLIQQVLSAAAAGNEALETQVSPASLRWPSAWKKAFRNVFGKDACLAKIATKRQAHSLGYDPVDLPHGLNAAMSLAGVPTSNDVLARYAKSKSVALASSLTDSERRVFEAAKKVAKEVVPDARVTSTRVVEEFSGQNPTRCEVNGRYRGTTVYLHRRCLQSMENAVGVLIHERVHGLGFYDEDRAFESKLTEIIGQVAMRPVVSY